MELKRRKGYTLVKQFPQDEPVVSMMIFKDTVYITTSKRVFRIVDDVVEPIEILLDKEENDETK